MTTSNFNVPELPEAGRRFCPQPLDQLLTGLGLQNHDLVEASTEQLTHKQVQKGRAGRPLTANIQNKILRALVAAQARRGEAKKWELSDLFRDVNES